MALWLTFGGLRSTEKAFLLPTQQPWVWIPSSPKKNYLHCLACKQYWDRIHQMLSNGLHKCSWLWRVELSTTKNLLINLFCLFSSAGVGRTGVFITLSIVLERMQYEGVVDVFQSVRALRTQRPAMVQTEDQYQFCYRAALEYLSSFDQL